MKTNYHSHTTRCNHAKGDDEDYVLSAIKAGYDEIGFSDHSPWPFENGYNSLIRMDVSELDDYVTSVRALKDKYKDQISIKIGLECEYYKEYIPWLKDVIKLYELDYLIFGNHFPKNEMHSYYSGTETKSKEALYDYLETAINGMESGLYAYLAHPDLFMRSYPTFDKHCAAISRKICEKAKELNMPLEYNISGYAYNELHNVASYPNPDFWKIAAEVGAPCIIGLDAHNNTVYENHGEYQRALREIEALNLKRVDRI